MRILGIVAITIVCAAVAAGICLIAFGMIPWIRQTWHQIKFEEKLRKEAEKKKAEKAKLMSMRLNMSHKMYTYDKNKKLVNLGEYRSVKW